MQIGNSQIAIQAIEKYDNIIVLHHIRPDGDCLGSQAGLVELIKTNYPNKNVYAVGDSLNSFEFMNFQYTDIKDINFENSLAIIVDASSGNRIQNAEIFYDNMTTAKLRIDHHPNDSDIVYDYIWVDEHYVAAAEMIAQMAYDAKWKVTKRASECIYLGINTDSGRFLYIDTSKRTYELVAFLMDNGFHPDFVLKNLGKKTYKQIKFIGKILSEFKKDKRVLYYEVTQKVLDEIQMDSFEAAMFVNELANIENNNVWAFFIQLEDGNIRGRLRSNGPKVNIIAQDYNGGGHDNAAGITLTSWDQVSEVVDKLNKLIIDWENQVC